MCIYVCVCVCIYIYMSLSLPLSCSLSLKAVLWALVAGIYTSISVTALRRHDSAHGAIVKTLIHVAYCEPEMSTLKADFALDQDERQQCAPGPACSDLGKRSGAEDEVTEVEKLK